MENKTEYQSEEIGLSFEDYIDLFSRRKWLIIIPLILSVIITICVYSLLPKIYRSDTLILVLPQNVPEDYVRPTVTTPIEGRLATITEEILSRTRLQSIINEFNLYPENIHKKPIEEIINNMKKDIKLAVTKEQNSFKIHYQGKNPETVRKVTNKLASLFIEENLKTREQQARITTDFLNRELNSAKEKLEEQEKALTEFKFKNIGYLPEQNIANLEMLGQLVEHRRMINDSIARAENKELLIHQQLSGIPQFLEEEKDANEISIQAQLQTVKSRLLILLSTHTENHIEVIKVREQIKQLSEQLIINEKTSDMETSEKSQTANPIALDLKAQLMVTNKEIKQLKKEKAITEQQIDIYEKRLEEVPHVELQLSALTRNYDNTKKFYEELLQKKLEAEQAENLERRQQGEQFKILDPASLPRIPFKPNPKKIFPIGIFLGIFSGCCLAFISEKLDNSFKNIKEAEEYLGVPVLAAIPLKKAKRA